MQTCAHLAEYEKCCQTHIVLQNFVLIQPRMSPPEVCKFCKRTLLTLLMRACGGAAAGRERERRRRLRGGPRRARGPADPRLAGASGRGAAENSWMESLSKIEFFTVTPELCFVFCGWTHRAGLRRRGTWSPLPTGAPRRFGRPGGPVG